MQHSRRGEEPGQQAGEDGSVAGQGGDDGLYRVALFTRERSRARWLDESVRRLGLPSTVFRPTGLQLAEGCGLAILDFPNHLGRALAACRRLRRFNPSILVLVICSANDSTERAMLFESGADQALAEPFGERELLARVARMVRRSDNPPACVDEAKAQTQAPPVMGTDELQALERRLVLTETERQLLRTLGRSRSPVSAAFLATEVFPGRTYRPESSHLRVHMHRLRRKLAAVDLSIEGIHGRGYRLFGLGAREEDEDEVPSSSQGAA